MQLLLAKNPTNLIDKIITYWTRCPYYHSVIRFRDGMCFEASRMSGVNKYYQSRLNGEYDVFEIPVSSSCEANGRVFARNQLGKSYDWRGIINFIVPIIKQKNRKGCGKWFCFELSFVILKEAGFLALDRIDDFKVDGQIGYSPLLKYKGTEIHQ